MHGQRESSYLPRTVWILAHLAVVAVAAWFYFGGGITKVGRSFGQEWQAGDQSRRVVLISFSVILWVRMTLTALVLLKRKFSWSECFPVTGAVVFYQWGFALLGAATPEPLEPPDLIGIGLFLFGGYLNTASELQRKRFKQKPANQGKLCTSGWFSAVRHPNYLGDILWASGWALITRNPWAALIPAAAAAGFVFGFIPKLSRYLEQKYGPSYKAWAERTPRLIPFLY